MFIHPTIAVFINNSNSLSFFFVYLFVYLSKFHVYFFNNEGVMTTPIFLEGLKKHVGVFFLIQWIMERINTPYSMV